jgi:Ca2+/Na+ antiporter
MKKIPNSVLAILLFIAGIIFSRITGFRLRASILILLSPLALYVAYVFVRIKYIYPIGQRKRDEQLRAALENHKKVLVSCSLHEELKEHKKMAASLLVNDQALKTSHETHL